LKEPRNTRKGKTMNKSETLTHLATALALAQAEMPVAVFDATNPFLKSKYASLGAVIQASRPILAKHKLSLIQFPISGPNPGRGNGTEGTDGTNGNGAHGGPSRTGEQRPTGDCIGVESILTHESGEFVSERILIALAEEKGKSRVQAAGSTLTYLRRYSWASILGMYSDEDSDGSSPVQAFTAKASATLPPPPVRKAESRN
jgi:hypothetical protein